MTITASDMFNQTGQYYRAYANYSSNTVAVTGMLGTKGGPQAWDFTTGPTNMIYRFDYIDPSLGTGGADFVAVGAKIAERKTDEGNASDQSFLYFLQDSSKGRLDYGFYDPSFSAAQPESVFTNALQDFPLAMHYGDTWSGSTIFYSVYTLAGYGDFPVQITYSSTDAVDAYGLVNLPSLGFMDCLRVHEVAEYDIAIDAGEGYQSAGTQYALNYYWLAPGHGIAVQINSAQSDNVPDDTLPGGATALVRMFDLNHTSGGTNAPTTIKGFKFTLGKTSALLQWTALTGVTSYKVEYTTALGTTNAWQTLGTTTANYMLDPAAATAGAPLRFYRVVGTLGK